jgi:hypothetical protein
VETALTLSTIKADQLKRCIVLKRGLDDGIRFYHYRTINLLSFHLFISAELLPTYCINFSSLLAFYELRTDVKDMM